jgi:hypothetical protein
VDIATNTGKDPCAMALAQKRDTTYIDGYEKIMYHNSFDKTGTATDKVAVTDLFT